MCSMSLHATQLDRCGWWFATRVASISKMLLKMFSPRFLTLGMLLCLSSLLSGAPTSTTPSMASQTMTYVNQSMSQSPTSLPSQVNQTTAPPANTASSASNQFTNNPTPESTDQSINDSTAHPMNMSVSPGMTTQQPMNATEASSQPPPQPMNVTSMSNASDSTTDMPMNATGISNQPSTQFPLNTTDSGTTSYRPMTSTAYSTMNATMGVETTPTPMNTTMAMNSTAISQEDATTTMDGSATMSPMNTTMGSNDYTSNTPMTTTEPLNQTATDTPINATANYTSQSMPSTPVTSATPTNQSTMPVNVTYTPTAKWTTQKPVNMTTATNDSVTFTPAVTAVTAVTTEPVTMTPATGTTVGRENQTTVEPGNATAESASSTLAPDTSSTPESNATTIPPPESSTAFDNASSSTGAVVSDANSTMPDNITETTEPKTTDQTSSTMMSTTQGETTTTTTSTSYRYSTRRPEKPFVLSIPVSQDSSDHNVHCMNCTPAIILDYFKLAFEKSGFRGFLYVRLGASAARRKRDTTVRVEVLFDPQTLSDMPQANRTAKMVEVLAALTSLRVPGAPSTTSPLFFVADSKKLANTFAQQTNNMCTAGDVCALGYRCVAGSPLVCVHLCEDLDCGEHGTCSVVIATDGAVNSSCVCESVFEKSYSGPRCREEKMGKDKQLAIVGGVLGAICLFLLLIIVFLYCRHRASLDQKYNITNGYSNDGFNEMATGKF
ncbi:hypothetical protein ACOMHN_057179 [Nucella lapillus]